MALPGFIFDLAYFAVCKTLAILFHRNTILTGWCANNQSLVDYGCLGVSL